MKKKRFKILSYWLVLFIGVPFHLLDTDGFDVCHVLAREGLSDAELYGNGQESILYPDSSQRKKEGNKENASENNIGNRKTQHRSTISGDAENKTSVSGDAQVMPMTSADAQSDMSILEDTKTLPASGDILLKEDIVVTGVEQDGIYNRDVTIELSAVRRNETVSVLAEICTVSGDGIMVDEKPAEEAVDGENTEKLDTNRRSQPGLQIGLSATGQLVSGKQRVSEDGKYELVVWQETNEGQELPKEQKILKKVGFMVDKTAPVIDKDLINRLCKKEINIGEICKKAVLDESKVTTSCLVNGQELEEGVIKRAGEYELVVKAEDEAGNKTQKQLQIALQDGEGKQEMRSRWMAPSVLVLLFGGGLLIREGRKEKKEKEYEQRDK